MLEKIDLHIEGMTCGGCSGRVERALNGLPGVTAHVSLLEHRARISGLNVDAAVAAVRRAGYDAWPIDPQTQFSISDQTRPRIEQFRDGITVIALIPMLIEMGAMMLRQESLIAAPVQLVLATLMQTLVAWPFYRSAVRAVRSGSANMETLVSLGTLSAYLWSVLVMFGLAGLEHNGASHAHSLYFEAAVVVLAMVRLGKLLETRARQRALSVLEHLIHLNNDPVRLFKASEDRWQQADPETVPLGSRVQVHPNEMVNLDGEIISGQTEIDESTLTGESQPVTRKAGEKIFAGCFNLSGEIEIKTTAAFSESRRAQIGAQILSALSSRAPIAAFADRVAAIFVPVVLVIAAVTAAAHLLLDHGAQIALQNAVAVLVVACPCALGLATPAAIAAGLGRAAQFGWLFRSADAMQRAAGVNEVIFDKTGTLTSGRPTVVAIDSSAGPISLSGQQAQDAPVQAWPDWLAAATAAERGVEHPLAGALFSYAAGRPMPEVSNVINTPGYGVSAAFSAGGQQKTIAVGKPAWIATLVPDASLIPPLGSAHDEASAVDVVINQEWQGRVWVADTLKQDAPQTIEKLHDEKLSVSILSGDRTPAVRHIAQRLNGIPFQAEQTPEQKTNLLSLMKQQGHRIAMVGDGLNDASAMAQSHLGIAMASGAGLTLQAADLTITNGDRLIGVAQCLAMSRAVMRRVKENLFFAFGFNSLAIPLAAMGYLSPVIAGTAMAASSAAVMLNASRLLAWRP
jgi:P-type Cu+ transporter